MLSDLYKLSAYQFHLPAELIAQQPAQPRDRSRLMLIDRKAERIEEIVFHEIVDILNAQDQLILNNTKVMPARLVGKRETGGMTEIFLIKRLSENSWEVLSRPAKKLLPGAKIYFSQDFFGEVLECLPEGRKKVCFYHKGSFDKLLEQHGRMPLPPYIRRENKLTEDHTNYQTVFAKQMGAVAAPTAGLHFTENVLEQLSRKGVDQTEITLHVGLGTFKPVQAEDIRQHQMHAEQVEISDITATKLNHARQSGGRQLCVGTTTCRALETAAQNEKIVSGCFETGIFIYPGYTFRYVKHLLTNFHLPGSSLLMLTCAFGGYELIMEAYQKAIKEKFRFYSYGDCMLIL